MSTPEEDDFQNRYALNREQLTESNRQIAYLTGRMEGTYAALPHDATLIAEVMRAAGATREQVVQRLEAISERELAKLRDANPLDIQPETVTPAVKRLRELLS